MILLLDDDRDYLFILENILVTHGFRKYKLFYNYKEFLKAIDKNVYLVVIDHDLKSGITGTEIMDLVMGINPFSKIIVCSGQENIKTAVDYYERGCFFYLFKDDKEFEKKFIEKIREGLGKVYVLLKRMAVKDMVEGIIKNLQKDGTVS